MVNIRSWFCIQFFRKTIPCPLQVGFLKDLILVLLKYIITIKIFCSNLPVLHQNEGELHTRALIYQQCIYTDVWVKAAYYHFYSKRTYEVVLALRNVCNCEQSSVHAFAQASICRKGKLQIESTASVTACNVNIHNSSVFLLLNKYSISNFL